MRTTIPVLLIAIFAALSAQPPSPASKTAAVPTACAPLGSARTRTTLYFGLNRKGGSVSERQWRNFLRDEVTPRFPEGLTVWQADGQWRTSEGGIARERAKVLLLVHDDTPQVKAAIETIIGALQGTVPAGVGTVGDGGGVRGILTECGVAAPAGRQSRFRPKGVASRHNNREPRPRYASLTETIGRGTSHNKRLKSVSERHLIRARRHEVRPAER